jgi:acyl dehydratase
MTAVSSALRLPPSTLGAVAEPREHAVDARWLMAYAAALGETDPRYFDTLSPAGPSAHPLFAVCYEWPVAVDLRERVIGAAIAPLSVHATHDLVVHRPPRAGDRLTTSARIVEVTPVKAGTLVVTRFESRDQHGAPVTTTRYGSIYRGVACDGPPAPPAGTTPSSGGHSRPPAPADPGEVRWEEPVAVGAQLAHVYTECARIWNPIHTDVAVARAAGLPAIILHGTATLALAVSRVVRRDLGGDPARVRGVAVRFTGMVPLPSTFTVRGRAASAAGIPFDAVDAAGHSVLGRGVIHR